MVFSYFAGEWTSSVVICFPFSKRKVTFLFPPRSQGLNNIIHIDFDYKKEFIYWVDSTRPSGRKINRMRLNGSDLKVPNVLDDVAACHMAVWALMPVLWLYKYLILLFIIHCYIIIVVMLFILITNTFSGGEKTEASCTSVSFSTTQPTAALYPFL